MNSVPGYREGRTYTPRNVTWDQKNLVVIGGIIVSTAIDGGNTGYTDELREGLIMGQITASKKWRPCPRTLVNGSGTLTALVVDDARAFIAGDVITVGADTGITVSAVDYTTNTLTIASTTVLDGEVVFAEDGSGTARAILGEFVKMKSTDDNTARDRSTGRLIVAGCVNDDIVLGDLTAVRAATGMYLNHVIWSDQQGYN